jgi:hypothetical protein
MVQALVRSFVDATPYLEEPADYVARELRLQSQLGRVLGVTPSAADIIELITTYEEIESVEAGTHQDLVTNMARTIDNTLAVTEHLLARVNRETSDLLDNAGFGKAVAA